MMPRFTILGAGWLGLELALRLKETYTLKLSSSSPEKIQTLKGLGFKNIYHFNEKNLDNLEALLDTDFLFINYPPSKFEDYIGFLSNIYNSKLLKKIKKVIFISSTSIYPNINGVFNESFILKNPVSQNVYNAEKLVEKQSHLIFRASGLIGANRIAGKRSASKEVDTALKKVNHVHRDDVINAVIFSIKNDLEGIFNLCAKGHPTCEELYLSNAKKYDFEEPIFTNSKDYKNRIIDGSKIEEYGFKYKYPNPLEF